MKITHVSDRAAREGTIDDVFGRLVAADPGWQTTLDLLKSLRTHVSGPEIWACESHHQLFLMPYDRPDAGTDENLDRFTQVQILARGSDMTVYYDVPASAASVPWQSRYCIQPATLVQATVVCCHAVATMLSIFDPAAEVPLLENHSPPVSARCVRGDGVTCPHCETPFSLTDSRVWDGERHLVCRQRLQIARA